MSMPNIPDIQPKINIDIEDSIKMLLNSIALEEMGLSHIINAEAEKVQYSLGTLDENPKNLVSNNLDMCSMLKVNESVDRTLRGVLKNQMLLQMKLEDTISLCDKFGVNFRDKNERNYDEGVSCSPEYFNDEDFNK